MSNEKQNMECKNLDIVDFESAKFFSNLRCIFCWQADFRMLIYTSCRSKRATVSTLTIKDRIIHRPWRFWRIFSNVSNETYTNGL